MLRQLRFLTKWRYVHLFFSLLFLIGVVPFIGIDLFLDVALGVVLFSSLFAVSKNKIALAAIVALYAASQVIHFTPLGRFRDFALIQNLLNFAWTLPVAVIITKDILKAKEVYKDMIFGGLCVYLFLGFAWSELYAFLLHIEPGCISSVTLPDMALRDPAVGYHLVYYSFVTLTTLGYGDMVPLTEKAMALAVLETVTGQLFLAVFIASMVGRLAGRSAREQVGAAEIKKPRSLD